VHNGSFVNDLATVLGVAAVTFVVFRKLGQPAVLGYLLAGLIVGPYIPFPLFADPHRIHALSEFGVVLVMFAIGIEFRIARLLRVLPVSGATASMQIGVLFWLGFVAGSWLGWTTVQSLFLGASVCISSTMIVSAVFEERAVSPDVREMALGILVLQDVAAIALIATMTVVANGGGLSAADLAVTLGRLALVLVSLLTAGLFVVPRATQALVKLDSSEALVVGASGLCFAMAALATWLGYSVALGAFIAGILVAESGHGEEVEHAITPLKSFFSAVFFVSIGMTVDPRLALSHAGAALLVSALVIAGQLVSVTLGGLLSGNGLRRSLGAGLALGQIGEFAFIIVGIAEAAGQAPEALSPIVVTVAVLTAFTTPIAIGLAPRLVHAIDHILPARLQNLLVVYEGWFARIGAARAREQGPSPSKQAGRAIVLDGLLLLGLLGAWRFKGHAGARLFERLTLDWGVAVSHQAADYAVSALALLVTLPLFYHLLRSTDQLARVAARQAFEAPADADDDPDPTLLVDRRESERLLLAAFRTTVLLGVGLPAAALSRSLLGTPYLALGVFVLTLPLVLRSWFAAGRLDTTIRSATEAALDILARQRAAESLAPVPPGVPARTSQLLPGSENLHRCHLQEGMPAVGQTLAKLDLRARTGAAVLAVHRPGHDVLIPSGSEPLLADDVLVLAGSPESLEAARSLLMQPQVTASSDTPAVPAAPAQ
jgi:CPA2 family monovalent cation:H+ antiporter-2